MKSLPITKDTPVLRSDFAEESAWCSLCVAIETPVGEFAAYVSFISDPAFEGLTPGALVAARPENFPHSVAFIADGVSLFGPEHTVLAVDLAGQPGRTFRVVPAEMWNVENNLSLANMGFEEFAEAVDADGVFRGFRTSDRA